MGQTWVPILAMVASSIVCATLISTAAAVSDNADVTLRFSPSSVMNNGTSPRKPLKGSPEYNQIFIQQTHDINTLILGRILPDSVTAQVPHVVLTWMRNLVAGIVIYFVCAGGIYLWNFWWRREKNFPAGNPLKKEPILEQLSLGLVALPIYTLLPTLAEFVVEKGWTLAYVDIEEVGWMSWAVHVFAYLSFCEFWVYWFHRWVHSPTLYKYLHHTHHYYNKKDTISPFAGLAFNPIDGLFQASPLFLALFVVPMHFQTYYLLFFFEEIWSANIHDTIEGGVFGILGAGYHNYHHTHYKYNYGHLTIYMDWLYGTLIDPKTGPKTGQRMVQQKALKNL